MYAAQHVDNGFFTPGYTRQGNDQAVTHISHFSTSSQCIFEQNISDCQATQFPVQLYSEICRWIRLAYPTLKVGESSFGFRP